MQRLEVATELCTPDMPNVWDAWEHLDGDELAREVTYYAEPLLKDKDVRDDMYQLLRARPLEKLSDDELLTSPHTLWAVKDETEHPGNAYKLRGAYWNIRWQLAANPEISEVHCTSTGNHGRGVVEACQWLNKTLGTNLTAVVHAPTSISPVKLQALEDMGADVRLSDSYESAHQETNDLKVQSVEPGSTVAVVEPYDDPRTMAGQASCGFEVVADFMGDLFTKEGVDLMHDDITLWVPGGGGGFAAGCAVAFDYYRSQGAFGANVKVKVAQMECCDALTRAHHGSERLTKETLDPSTDATALLEGGALTQKILGDKRYVADFVSVPKRYVGLAMEMLERHHGHPVEPAGALALAASLWFEDTNPPRENSPRRVNVAVTSGANVSRKTREHFAEAVPAGFSFERQSKAYQQREVYGVDEVLARKRGGTVLNGLQVANGATS